MQVRIASVMVDDQDKALHFYTTMLGFEKKHDIAMGGEYCWLTVPSPDGVEGASWCSNARICRHRAPIGRRVSRQAFRR